VSSTESEPKGKKEDQPRSIDYSKSAADVREAKDKAHDADAKRLAKEHEASA
jgi:hypothetical protein